MYINIKSKTSTVKYRKYFVIIQRCLLNDMTCKNTQNKISQIAIKFQFSVPVIKTNEVLNF